MLEHGRLRDRVLLPGRARATQARIRVQISAAHTEADIEACVQAFVAARAAVLG